MPWPSRTIPRRTGKKKVPRYAPYRSALEKRVADKIHNAYLYEHSKSRVKYTVSHVYCPDFVHPDAPNVIFEIKGYFRQSSEASKYVHVKKANPDKELIFIFSNCDKKAHPNCRPRKDGTVLTLREWATKEGFLFYNEKALPTEIIQGEINEEWIKSERGRFGYDN